MKIIVIIGLPGSGKTILGKQLESKGYYFIDDISVCGLNKFLDAIEYKIDKIALADCFLCREKDREKCAAFLTKYTDNIEWIFFENNTQKCCLNVDRRNDGRLVKDLIDILSKEYNIPQDKDIRRIFNG
jgi:RNase adaptor protein for sRNA GlmZ degradation